MLLLIFSIISVDKQFPKRFQKYCRSEGAEWNDLNGHLITHVAFILKLHKIILEYLEATAIDKAQDIIRLIVVSHSLMKIPQSEYRVIYFISAVLLIMPAFSC